MYSWTAVLPPSHRSIHRICNMAPMCTPFLETALKRHLDQFSHLCTAHPRAQHTRTRRRTVKYNRPYLCCTCDAAYNLHTGMKYFSSGIISGYVDWILLMSLSLSIPFRAVCFCYGQFNATRRHYVTGYCGVCNCILVLPVCGYTVSNVDRVNESGARYIVWCRPIVDLVVTSRSQLRLHVGAAATLYGWYTK